MSGRLERSWVSLVDSKAFRRVAGGRLGRAVVKGRAVRSLRSRVVQRQALADVNRLRADLAGIETCVVFVGHTKSGGSLTGAMLDAHPSAVCADELDLTGRLDTVERDEAFAQIIKNSRREALKGRVTARRLDPYSLAIPGLWQGRYETLRLVGDTRAGPTTRRLGADMGAIDRLRLRLGDVRLHVVQVVRSPHDPIGAMVGRSGRSIDDAIADYRDQCERLVLIRSRLGASEYSVVRYEDLIATPRAVLEGLARDLGLELRDDWLAGCERLVDTTTRRDRGRASWSSEHLAAIDDLVHDFDFLADYAGLA